MALIDLLAARSHRGGHWFDPSIAHPAHRPVPFGGIGRFAFRTSPKYSNVLTVQPLTELPQGSAGGGDAATGAHELLALSYQAVAAVLTKLGEADLAWIAAERGLTAAQRTDSTVIVTSLFRSVAHTLLGTGRFGPAVQLVERAAAVLGSDLGAADGAMLSVYGSLFLTGAMAASRAEVRPTTRAFLREAGQAAGRLGTDANYMWTARLRLRWGWGQMGWGPEGWIRIEVPRGQLDDFIRAFRQAARDADAEYQAILRQRREWAQRDAQARRERQADPARRARLAEDQARIDAALAETGQ